MPSPRKLRRGLWFSEVSRTWHFEFKRGGKKKGDTGCPTRALAEKWLVEHKARLALRDVGLGTVPTLGQALEEWEEAHKGVLVKGYVDQMGHLVRTHLAPHLGLPLDALTTEAMERARSAYLGTVGNQERFGKKWALPHSVGGANTLLKMVNALYGWVIRSRGWIKQRPYRLARKKAQEKVKAIIWPEQVQAFLREVDRGAFAWSGQVVEREREPHVRLAIRLQIGLGLRETEALGFRWEWLDRRNRVYTPGATKNRKTRIIPVPEWLFLELQQLWETVKRPATGFAMLGEDHRPHRKGFTLSPVKASGAQLGIVNLHPHRLRATFATSHWEAGTALAQIQQMLGHKDPETTMRYIVMRPKETAAAQDKVAAMMGFRSPSGPRAPKHEVAS